MVLLVLVGLVAALAPVVRVGVRSAGREGEELKALYLARAGVHLAVAVLQRDDPNVDGPEDEWAALGGTPPGASGQPVGGGAVQTEYPLGEGRFRLEVVDASSRIDLNRADRETLLRLPGIDETTVDEILAWRGQGQDQTNSSSVYESLPQPYRLKGAPFDSVEELLLVQGVTPLLFYGPREIIQTEEQAPWVNLLFVDTSGPNVDAEGAPRINLNTATADQLARASGGALNPPQAQAIVQQRGSSGQFSSLASLLTVPGLRQSAVEQLLDRVTLTPGEQLAGRLNLNTATVHALETLPGVTAEMADRIVERRETEGEFQSVGDLMELDAETFRVLVDRVTTKSSVFIVRAIGELDSGSGSRRYGAIRAMEAWVRREGGRARVTRWREVRRSPGWDTWGWNLVTWPGPDQLSGNGSSGSRLRTPGTRS